MYVDKSRLPKLENEREVILCGRRAVILTDMKNKHGRDLLVLNVYDGGADTMHRSVVYIGEAGALQLARVLERFAADSKEAATIPPASADDADNDDAPIFSRGPVHGRVAP